MNRTRCQSALNRIKLKYAFRDLSCMQFYLHTETPNTFSNSILNNLPA